MLIKDIKDATKENNDFRRVIFTGSYSQLVLMSLSPGENIGEETHPSIDQIFFVIKGTGKAVLNDVVNEIKKHTGVYVTAGTKHDIINSGEEDLKLYTIYSPPAHKDGTIHATKEEAQREGNHY